MGSLPRRRRTRGTSRAVERGRRVFLRLPVESDRAEFRALLEVSRDFLRPWEPRLPGGPGVRFDRLLAAGTQSASRKHFVCRTEDGVLMGMMNVNNVIHGVFQSASLGYWIGADYARQGYMGDALELALRHAFRTLRLHRVEANIRPENTPSIRLVVRAGFRKEGYSPRYLKIAGRWSDHVRYALLREEWRPRRV